MAFYEFARSYRTLSLATLMGLTVVACSPDMFSEDGRDSKVSQVPAYRNVREVCSGIKMSSAQIGAPEFRGLLSCLNGNGNLQAMVELTQKLTDEELAPVVNILNQSLLGNPAALYSVEKSIDHMEQSAILDSLFEQTARVLDHSKLISTLVEVLDAGYRDDPEGFHWLMGKLSEWLSNGKNLEDAMDGVLLAASTPAYQDLQNHLRCPQGSGRCEPELDQTIQSVLKYIGSPGNAGEKFLSQWAGDPYFSTLLDESIGSTQEQIRQKAWKYSSLLSFLGNTELPNGSSAFFGMSQLFFELHGKDLSCLRQSLKIKDPDWFVLRELLDHNLAAPKEFLGRFVPLTLLTMSGFCDLGNKAAGYPSLVAISQQPQHLDTLNDLLIRADSYRDSEGKSGYLLKSLIDVLSQSGVSQLAPAVQSLSQRDAWSPALLMASLPQAESQEKLKKHLQFFLREENGRSVHRQLIKILAASSGNLLFQSEQKKSWKDWFKVLDFSSSGVSTPPLYRLMWESSDLMNEPPMLAPVLSTLRNVYYINDTHALYGIFFEFIKNSRQHDAALRTLFKMAAMPEFPKTLKMASDLARRGELKTIIKTLTDLFHRFALQGASEIAKRDIPLTQITWRHQLTSADLESHQADLLLAGSGAVPACGACGELDFALSMDRFWEGDQYAAQLDRFSQCLSPESEIFDSNSIVVRKKMASTMRWLRDQPLSGVNSVVPAVGTGDSSAIQILNHFDLMVDVFRLFSAPSVIGAGGGSTHDQAALSFLVEKIKLKLDAPSGQPTQKSEVQKLLSGVSFWIQNRIVGAALDVLSPVYKQKKDQITKILNFLATELGGDSASRGDVFPALALYANEARKGMDAGVSLPDMNTLSRFNYVRSTRNPESEAEIATWIAELYKAECIDGAPVLGRKDPFFAAKLREYDEAYNAWDRERYSWGLDELKASVKNLLGMYAKSEEYHARNGGQSASSRVLSVIRDFSKGIPGGTGNYSAQFFADWVHDRSVDQYKILYFYPGEKKARMRIVSSLDLLELVLLNADFKVQARNAVAETLLSLFAGRNFAVKFLGDIGKSWGDEPKENWPKEIHQLYPNGKSPTLRETFEDIVGTLNKFSTLVYPDVKNDDPYEAIATCSQIDGERGRKMNSSFGSVLSKLALTEEEITEVKRRMFNLAQVVNVIAWNLPATDWCADHKEYQCAGKEYLADGMKVLRQFFFHIYAANEVSDGKEPFHPKYKIDDQKNTLNIMTQMVRMGLIRQISRQVTFFSERKSLGHRDQNFKPTAAYYSFFNTLMQAVVIKNPKTDKFYADEVLAKLLSPSEITGPQGFEESMFWKLISRTYRRLDEDRSYATGHQLKTMLIYAIQLLGVGPSGLKLVPEVVSVVADVVARDLDLIKRTDRLDWWLRTPRLAGALEQVYRTTNGTFYEKGSDLEQYGYECHSGKQLCWKTNTLAKEQISQLTKRAISKELHRSGLDILRVAETVPAWNELATRWDRLDQAVNSRGEKYKDLNLSEILGDSLVFFSTGSQSQGASPAWDASTRIREHLKLMLGDSKYMDLWLRLAANAPREVSQELIETLDTSIETRQIDELLGFLNRALKQSTVDVR